MPRGRYAERIRSLLVRGREDRADALGPVAGCLRRAVGRELGSAAVDYRSRASRFLTFATLGSAVTILVLVALFGVFYLRASRAHATPGGLAKENARLMLHESQLQVIQRLSLAGEYRDDDTGEHTRRVADLSARIAAALGMPQDQLRLLRQAAPMHDVGKIGIPDRILLKPGRLTQEEFEQMKAHTRSAPARSPGAAASRSWRWPRRSP